MSHTRVGLPINQCIPPLDATEEWLPNKRDTLTHGSLSPTPPNLSDRQQSFLGTPEPPPPPPPPLPPAALDVNATSPPPSASAHPAQSVIFDYGELAVLVAFYGITFVLGLLSNIAMLHVILGKGRG